MILLITGASHTGKTALAQKLLEKYKYPYLSIDHLKMGLIRSGYTELTPVSDDKALTAYLWPVVRQLNIHLIGLVDQYVGGSVADTLLQHPGIVPANRLYRTVLVLAPVFNDAGKLPDIVNGCTAEEWKYCYAAGVAACWQISRRGT